MSIIKPRTRGKQLVQLRTRVDRQNHETLHAYAAFIGEEPEYVLNELIDTVLAKDKDFVKWRAEHPQAFAPRPAATRVLNGARSRAARDADIGVPATALGGSSR